VVEEVTTIHRVVGAEGRGSVSIASVRLDEGPVVVAGVDDQTRPGDRVDLYAVDGAPVAQPERASD
jgi:hypothetical protein